MSARERLDACYQHAVLKHLSDSAMTNQTLRKRLKMPEQHCRGMNTAIQKVTGGDVAAVQKAQSRQRRMSSPAFIAPLHIILWLLCGEQKGQNPKRNALLGTGWRRTGFLTG